MSAVNHETIKREFAKWRAKNSDKLMKFPASVQFKFMLVNYPTFDTAVDLERVSGCHSSSVSEAILKMRKNGEVTTGHMSGNITHYNKGNYDYDLFRIAEAIAKPPKVSVPAQSIVAPLPVQEVPVVPKKTPKQCLKRLKAFLHGKFGEKYCEHVDAECFSMQGCDDCEVLVQNMIELFSECYLEDTNTCWKTEKHHAYRTVMGWKANGVTRGKIGQLMNFPWSVQHKIIVRHDPINCEAFNNVHDHSKCCRPSHLCYGTHADNKNDTNVAKGVRNALRQAGLRAEDSSSQSSDSDDEAAQEDMEGIASVQASLKRMEVNGIARK